jgi:acyl carrier protein
MQTNGASPDRAEILAVVVSIVEEAISLAGPPPQDLVLDEETALLGPAAALDSMGLVTLIVDLEQRIEEQYGQTVIFADEQAMSRRNSPFRTIGTLTDHVYQAMGASG